jgi:hypothetical protein
MLTINVHLSNDRFFGSLRIFQYTTLKLRPRSRHCNCDVAGVRIPFGGKIETEMVGFHRHLDYSIRLTTRDEQCSGSSSCHSNGVFNSQLLMQIATAVSLCIFQRDSEQCSSVVIASHFPTITFTDRNVSLMTTGFRQATVFIRNIINHKLCVP